MSVAGIAGNAFGSKSWIDTRKGDTVKKQIMRLREKVFGCQRANDLGALRFRAQIENTIWVQVADGYYCNLFYGCLTIPHLQLTSPYYYDTTSIHHPRHDLEGDIVILLLPYLSISSSIF